MVQDNQHAKAPTRLEEYGVEFQTISKQTNIEPTETQTQIIDDYSQYEQEDCTVATGEEITQCSGFDTLRNSSNVHKTDHLSHISKDVISNPYKNEISCNSYTAAQKVTPKKHNDVSVDEMSTKNVRTTKISDKTKNSSGDAIKFVQDESYHSELRICDVSTTTEAKAKNWFPKAKSLYNEKVKASINIVGFQGLSKETHACGVNNIEIDLSEREYCKHCLRTHDFYHKAVHMNYIRKKVLTVYQNKANLFAPEHIMKTVTQSYNESRRVDVCTRFKFYDITEETMPGCVEELGKALVNTVNELRGITRNNQEMKDGIVQYVRAKRFRRG